MKDYVATLLRKQNLLAEEILSCRQAASLDGTALPQVQQMTMPRPTTQGETSPVTAEKYAPAEAVDEPVGRTLPDALSLWPGRETSDSGLAEIWRQDGVYGKTTAVPGQMAGTADMWEISRFFQRDARRFREE